MLPGVDVRLSEDRGVPVEVAAMPRWRMSVYGRSAWKLAALERSCDGQSGRIFSAWNGIRRHVYLYLTIVAFYLSPAQAELLNPPN